MIQAAFCHKCGSSKPLEERGSICRACKSANSLAWQKKNPERVRDNYRRLKYGLEPGEYDRLLETQGGVCPICANKLEGRGRQVVIDHCHETGKVRGVIHQRCNVALGQLGDSVVTALRAASYLHHHSCNDDVEFADELSRRMPDVVS